MKEVSGRSGQDRRCFGHELNPVSIRKSVFRFGRFNNDTKFGLRLLSLILVGPMDPGFRMKIILVSESTDNRMAHFFPQAIDFVEPGLFKPFQVIC